MGGTAASETKTIEINAAVSVADEPTMNFTFTSNGETLVTSEISSPQGEQFPNNEVTTSVIGRIQSAGVITQELEVFFYINDIPVSSVIVDSGTIVDESYEWLFVSFETGDRLGIGIVTP